MQQQGVRYASVQAGSRKVAHDSDITDLLTKGKTRTLNGFTSKQGKPFSAAMPLTRISTRNSSLQSAKQQKSEEM